MHPYQSESPSLVGTKRKNRSRLNDELIRLLEIRVEELERRVSLLESRNNCTFLVGWNLCKKRGSTTRGDSCVEVWKDGSGGSEEPHGAVLSQGRQDQQ